MLKNILRRFGFGTPAATPINKLKPGGSFCIEGMAFGIPGPHIAPFSGIAAATMSIEQEQLRERSGDTLFGGHSNQSWVVINDIDFGQKFYVRDDTGVIRVDRQGWSRLRATRRAARKLPNERRDDSLARFRHAYAGDPSLDILESVGLERTIPELRCYETVVPEQSRVRIVGKVRSTGEPSPTGAAFPPAPATFREAPRLLEIFPPDQDRLEIRVLLAK